ncbi:MAG: succinylglutamate desuccinylase [Deltaproteobacteria bacterium]|nr:succinylglutamate desuccinylase [Deltaproteobacteria bacterium]
MFKGSRQIWWLAFSLAAAIFIITSSAFAEKLLCVSRQEIRGEETVGQCLAKGDRFAVMDDQGRVRLVGPQEMEALRKYRPEILEMRAYGLKCTELAPDIPRGKPLRPPFLEMGPGGPAR